MEIMQKHESLKYSGQLPFLESWYCSILIKTHKLNRSISSIYYAAINSMPIKVLHGMKNDYDIKIMKTKDEKMQIVWPKI